MRIAIEEVSKRFGAVRAVDRVTLDIADGELFTLLGPSGCGKTTLLRLVAGFHRPDAGAIRFGERVVNDVPPHARNIGMVFQNYALWPHMTVFQNVAYGLRIRRTRGHALAEQVEAGLAKVNLGGLGGRYPGQLSGGQQQRVALARALVLSPDILLLDEPLSNLDAKIRLQVRAEVRRLQQEVGITTLYVTHDQEEALSLSDRVAVMRDGRVVQLGRPRELYERPRTRFVADFVGTNNLIPGRVAALEGDVAVVETALGLLRSRAGEIAVGQPCTVAVRPENLTLGDATGENRVRGRVALAAYLGGTLRYDIDVGAATLKVDIRDAWHHEGLPPGAEVVLSFPASAALGLPAEDGPSGAPARPAPPPAAPDGETGDRVGRPAAAAPPARPR
jgi:iron(III) transport system ATP-binding protein